MKLCYHLPLLLSLAAFPALAQTEERILSGTEAAQRAARECQVQPTFVSVEKSWDGQFYYQLSPTLSVEQVGCIRSALGRLGVFKGR